MRSKALDLQQTYLVCMRSVTSRSGSVKRVASAVGEGSVVVVKGASSSQHL